MRYRYVPLMWTNCLLMDHCGQLSLMDDSRGTYVTPTRYGDGSEANGTNLANIKRIFEYVAKHQILPWLEYKDLFTLDIALPYSRKTHTIIPSYPTLDMKFGIKAHQNHR